MQAAGTGVPGAFENIDMISDVVPIFRPGSREFFGDFFSMGVVLFDATYDSQDAPGDIARAGFYTVGPQVAAPP